MDEIENQKKIEKCKNSDNSKPMQQVEGSVRNLLGGNKTVLVHFPWDNLLVVI